MSHIACGAVIASPRGFFAWWESVLSPRYDGDDATCYARPAFTEDPDAVRVYSSVRAAERARVKIDRKTFEPTAVVALTEEL